MGGSKSRIQLTPRAAKEEEAGGKVINYCVLRVTIQRVIEFQNECDKTVN